MMIVPLVLSVCVLLAPIIFIILTKGQSLIGYLAIPVAIMISTIIHVRKVDIELDENEIEIIKEHEDFTVTIMYKDDTLKTFKHNEDVYMLINECCKFTLRYYEDIFALRNHPRIIINCDEDNTNNNEYRL